MTVSDAVLVVWARLPDEFYGTELIREVRELVNRPYMYDETALRKMRLLFHGRYTVINKLHSKYRKKSDADCGFYMGA